MFGSSFGLFIANANQTETTTIIDHFTPRLGDNRTAFVKFSNSTGLYLTEKGITPELESYVEAQWKIDYREAYQKYQERLEKEREHKNYINALQKITDIICSPLTILFSILDPLQLPSITLSLPTEVTQMFQLPTTTDIIVGEGSVIEDTLVEPNINDFQPASLPDIKFGIGESNDTHVWINDPTNKTDGYYISVDETYVELNASRGQENQHYYNVTSGEYTYQSNYLVNKTGIIDNTDWVTEEEYPNRFVFRLTNGSNYFFSTPEEITAFSASYLV